MSVLRRTTERRSRKLRPCEARSSDRCLRVIRPGDRYQEHVLAPRSDLGYDCWLRLHSCLECG